MSSIPKKFSDITELFSADGYQFLVVRGRLESLEKQAESGDSNAKELVEVFNRFHRLMMVLRG